ncbi:DUF1501 domain-containing protein [Telmatocola sphagniphila]|uniref:DUF1501 domain-containing protein n=1 Tax=Telmatocola sphagniphila TaxID=1123043 RepID=A0A8E6B1X5_9BACT|nr:DUF1501 domain-containing protein [Telmatocola sphagniphila]QVL30373.1 DUF1501 domain-containing protein [Telmatocola sphagniphila]
MLNLPNRCPGPQSRREFLRTGLFGLGALSLPQLMRMQSQAKANPSGSDDTSVIFIWLPGGPPHLETYDMKPDAPTEYRGDFKPIKTNVPGIDICEHLPLHAKMADKYTLIRSVSHTFSDHGGGHKRFLTGRDPQEPTGFVNDHPMVGSIVAKCREDRNVGLPNYISGVDSGRQGVDVFSFGAAYLGPSYTPFFVPGDPQLPDFSVQNLKMSPGMVANLDDRQKLLASFDSLNRGIDKTGTMAALDTFEKQAVELITSPKAKKAFDLSQEPQKLRERYGMHRFGQRCILARRLVEAGVSFVTMVLENPGELPADCCYNWDSHAVNCHIFTDTKYKLKFYDQAITALVEDLHNRGLTKKVLLIVTGEFGRTPKLSYEKGRPGRDHWPQAMSMLLAGGGIRHGQVIGSTDAKGEHPKDRPLSPNDLWATMYQHLGIDPEKSFLDNLGRPMPILPYGKPIADLFS